MLGECYKDGHGVAENDAEAMRWYHVSAAQGYADSQLMLGIGYQYGFGGKCDSAEAIKWYRKAAKQGNSKAYAQLLKLGVQLDPHSFM